MELDLGGIAKGWIADRIRDFWHAYGVNAGIINLGGNILLVGDSPKDPMVNGQSEFKILKNHVATTLHL